MQAPVAPAWTDESIRSEVTQLLQQLLRIDTSNPPGSETPAAELLREYLESAGLRCELVARRPDRANLIARLPGRGTGPSLALLGHTDVVPAPDADEWTHPPFSGHLDDDGFVWGRGALDMKNQTATRAVTLAALSRAGFVPQGDIVFIAQADEEDGRDAFGLSWLARERPELACDYSLDEGGGRRLELADGRVVQTINVGEKATLPVLLTAHGEGGHASVPHNANAVIRLATLILRLAEHRTEVRVSPSTQRLLELLVGACDGDIAARLNRARALHPWLAENLQASFSATIAPTRLTGSPALNVLPDRASVECDCRVLPGMTEEDLKREFAAALGSDIPYSFEFLEPPLGGSTSPIETPLYALCQEFLDADDPGATLLPTVTTGFNDSYFMRSEFGTVAYGFWPDRRTPPAAHAGVHGRDERVHVDDLLHATRFHLFVAQRIGLYDQLCEELR